MSPRWGLLLPSMRERRRGRIVNIASIGGKLGIPHLLPYSASKVAALGFSQGLRAEVARDGVVVTTAIPGLMRTGSPCNAIFRGRHRAEYAWFSIGDSLPGLSVRVDEASRRILSASRRGDKDSQSGFPPSWLTRRGDEAARRYNQVAPTEGSSA